jgi:predicted AAA+ superfamily ATPase
MKHVQKYQRPSLDVLLSAIRRDRPVFQVLVGPRQVGKTTLAKQLMDRVGFPAVYASADAPLPPGPEWLETQWHVAVSSVAPGKPVLLVLDEIQKVRGWAEALKRLWDAREEASADVRLLILGSSALLLQEGLATSLAGRFFLHRCTHWSYAECRDAFGWDLDQWLYFGGYPGAVPFIGIEEEWRQYVSDSLIESVLAKDVLQTNRITKPALLRHLFALSATFPAQILSYNKMLGQLHDAGNTTTLAGYLQLLGSAFLVSGLEAYWAGRKRRRGSSPKLVLWNNALVNAMSTRAFSATRSDRALWGRLVENAVGAHLLNSLPPAQYSVTYWHEGDEEVDYVVESAKDLWAMEVKSGSPGKLSGLAAFRKRMPKSRVLIVGADGMPLEDFFLSQPTELLSR